MIDLENTLFIVDGQSEAYSFEKKFKTEFKRTPEFRRATANGKDVTPEIYVNSIYGSLCRALNGKYRHIICILDREERKMAAVDFGASISKEIKRRLSKDFNDEQLKKITVVVSDRCFENWIVADIEGIKNKKDLICQDIHRDNNKYIFEGKTGKETLKTDEIEGRNGATILKKITSGKYKKTTHADILFNCVRFDVARENSTSFDRFCSTINYP